MEVILRASVIFVLLFFLTRGLRRRTLADMAPFELLLLVILGDIIQQGVTQEDYSVTGAALAASTFAFWITVLTYATWRWRRVATVVDGTPVVIIKDGAPLERTLASERLPLSEVMEAARQHGLDSLTTVRYGVLESTGRISFITSDGPSEPGEEPAQ